MFKQIIYFLLLAGLFASCEDIYSPAIDSVEGQLVVEALITNDTSFNLVHLSYARNYSSNQSVPVVSGARVELIDNNGIIIPGIEKEWGFFHFNTLPKVGRTYKLRIFLKKDIYESEMVVMPPIPVITSFYTEHIIKKTSESDGNYVPVGSLIQGREMYADMPISSQLSYYRFDVRSIVEWVYSPVPLSGPVPPPTFGWQSYFERNQFNLTGLKEFSQIGKIERYPLLMLAYDADYYLHSNDTLVPNGWILVFDQFGTSKESFEYHEKLNSQFAAEGYLFDPIQTQVYGNIACITDPKKFAFGYFDLNSHQQYRYYYDMSGLGGQMTLRQLFNFPDIPDWGRIIKSPPDWWEK